MNGRRRHSKAFTLSIATALSLSAAVAYGQLPPAPRDAPGKGSTPPKPPAKKPSCPAGAGGSQIIQCVTAFFEHGQYRVVVRLLRPAIERNRIPQKADLVEALRMYGISLHLSGLKGAAEIVFYRLVTLDPRLKLDPRMVPPEVVLSFEKIRRRRLAEMLRKRKVKPKRRYGILNFLPPAGQFQNRHKTKGWILLGLEVAFLATNIATYFALRSSGLKGDGNYVVQDIDGNIIDDNRTTARALLGVNYASFGLLMATLVYGMVDGWVYMRRLDRRDRCLRGRDG